MIEALRCLQCRFLTAICNIRSARNLGRIINQTTYLVQAHHLDRYQPKLGLSTRWAFLTADELECIREIRNVFAHSMTDIRFDTKEIATVIQRITVLSRVEGTDKDQDWDPTSRTRFLISVSF